METSGPVVTLAVVCLWAGQVEEQIGWMRSRRDTLLKWMVLGFGKT